MNSDSDAYIKKKHFFKKVLTLYGRKPALEAMQNQGIKVFKLHLSKSNKPAKIIDEMIALAKKDNAEIIYHDKLALSRISKNAKQDQGVAVDLIMPQFLTLTDAINNRLHRLIALDRIQNPQNLGMIIRTVCASGIDGLIIPSKGSAKLDALVIKASAGTLFKTPIIICDK